MTTATVPPTSGRPPADAGPSTAAGPGRAARAVRDTSADTEVQTAVGSGPRVP